MRVGPFIVAVTGGIGSGKSEVTQRFASLGVKVIDADVIARELVAPGQPALAEIQRRFGGAVIAEDGQLDRRKMRSEIFADPAKKQLLEALLHPLIASIMQQRASSAAGPYVVLAIPLLAESHRYDWVDRVVVVDAPETVQRERIMRRDALDGSQAEAVMQSQAKRAQRLAIADDVIENSGDLSLLDEAVKDLHAGYLEIARRLLGDMSARGVLREWLAGTDAVEPGTSDGPCPAADFFATSGTDSSKTAASKRPAHLPTRPSLRWFLWLRRCWGSCPRFRFSRPGRNN